ncbi:hypothetical protein CANMA_004105 [Candida margitis]|uniref:uncharacterized protein n=1 Tax=Candida margitis TaxID=1775924 RepID=UPI002227B235|nr:uncharacterized protein CANMA_004105 [Candida margitis]KAI5959669.1 hypothetical protein CANMA_004105 [Candida margitis]
MESKEYDPRATALLIEHLGFAPIKIVDEVINAVNQIMVQGIEALENYLTNNHAQGQLPENITPDEILSGTAKLESLLQFRIDNAFDKYELYCLSNILHIPSDLVHDGWFRLKSHEGIDFTKIEANPEAKSEYDDEILRMSDLIQQELYKRQYYKLQLVTFDKIKQYLELVSDKFGQLYQLGGGDDLQKGHLPAKEILERLSPIDNTVEQIAMQLKEVINQVEIAKSRLSSVDLKNVKFDYGDEYIEKRKTRILKDLNLDIVPTEASHVENGTGTKDKNEETLDVEMLNSIANADVVHSAIRVAETVTNDSQRK